MKQNITTQADKTTTSRIIQICESFETIEKEAANAEAAALKAKEEYKIAKIDDGNTDPAAIFDRKTAAKRLLFICEAQAKRAAAKLEDAKPGFDSSIESLAAPLLEELAKKRLANAELLTNELAKKTSPEAAIEQAKNFLRNFISCCAGVTEFDIAIGAIHQSLQRLPAHGAKVSGLTNALRKAESLI